jgi:two-component system chemotaxis response regulator CheY
MERRRPRKPPTRPLVLIVDGHDDTRALYALALSGMGFDVVPASDGDDACFRAWATHPDVIVTEVSLPPMDGWSFVQNLKRDPRTRDIPVVVLTGHAQRSVHERAEREGCVAVFVKPCLPDQLALGLRELLNRDSARDAMTAS